MSLTPQAIKDQEFQIKFRGYDTLEVKAYLELLAEEFFELHEQNRKLAEDSAALAEEKESLQREKEGLLKDIGKQREELESLRDEAKRKDERNSSLQKEADELQTLLAGSRQETQLAKEMVESAEGTMRQERENAATRLREEREAAEVKIAATQEGAQQLRLESEKLQQRIQTLEEQNRELKKGEVDFKSTIVAAQKFSEDLKKRSEKEAKQLMEKARTDVENFRRQAQEELAHLPLEIEKLHKKRTEVRDELKMVLNSYLQNLDIFSEVEEAAREEDLTELFQSIQIPENGMIDPVDLEKINLKLS